jgi:hypothetical protein
MFGGDDVLLHRREHSPARGDSGLPQDAASTLMKRRHGVVSKHLAFPAGG